VIIMAKMIDFCKDAHGHYRFNVAGGGDFAEAIARLKTIPLHQRAWHEDTKKWEIWPTPQNEELLRTTFENGPLCLDSLKWQMRLI